jgi:hypothetical protein
MGSNIYLLSNHKKEILNRLLVAWEKVPYMNLGMLLESSVLGGAHHLSDEEFIETVETYVYPRRVT